MPYHCDTHAGSLVACGAYRCRRSQRAACSRRHDGHHAAITFTLYCGDYWASNYIDPSWTDPLAQELTKRTGVTLKVTVPASDDDEGEMNKLIASGNLPDLIFRTGGASKDTLETGGYTKPLDDLIAKYAPNITKYMSGSFPAWRNRTDGKIYCLGLWYLNKVCKPALNLQVNTLQMRYDILKELGYAKLDRSTDGSMNSFITWQDYLNLLAQVKAKYPDMIARARAARRPDRK